MLTASENVLGTQKTAGNKSVGTNSFERGCSYACVSQSSRKLEEEKAPAIGIASLRSRTPPSIVKDLLEDILLRSTNRPTLRKAGESPHLLGSVRNLVNHGSTKSKDPEIDSVGVLTPKTSDCNESPFTRRSTAEIESNNSDTEDDTALLKSPLDKPGQDAISEMVRTKNERDTSKIYIPRPNFVATEDHTLLKVGTISAVLDDAVVVTTFDLAKTPRQLSDADISDATALDTDSLLCFSNGTVLGAVFETFGPVSSPLYVVRFNNSDEIPTLARVGAEIKYIEQETRLVRGRDIRGKGYDASGKDDEEVDAEEFSDDETERRSKKTKRLGSVNQSFRPKKRTRAQYEQRVHRRNEHEARNHESHRAEHESRQHYELKPRAAKRPANQVVDIMSRGFSPGPSSRYHNEIIALPHSQALTGQPSLPGGVNNNIQNVRTMSASYTSMVPGNAPYSLISPAMYPGQDAMLPIGNYLRSPSEFPQSGPPYCAPSTVSQQSYFVRPEQSWSAPNSSVIRFGSHRASTYQQNWTTEGQYGPAPGMPPSGLHQFQEPYVWKKA